MSAVYDIADFEDLLFDLTDGWKIQEWADMEFGVDWILDEHFRNLHFVDYARDCIRREEAERMLRERLQEGADEGAVG